MKQIIHTTCRAAFLGAIFITSQATLSAQVASGSTTVTQTQTTSSVGTISEFSPETIVIKTEASPDPLRYTYSKTTTYVDESGAPVAQTVVKSGVPVTVFYTQDGDKRVASKVVVRKTVTTVAQPAAGTETKKTTTTKTTTEK